MFATVGIAALAAAAFAFLRGRVETRGGRGALTVVVFGLLLAEMWIVPIGLVEPDRGIDDHRAVVEWLEEHGGGEAVLELPMAEGTGESALAREVLAMRRALRHGNPVVNGYSGYFPEPFLQVREAVLTDPTGKGLRYLAALGVRHLLIHDHDYAAPRARQIATGLGGRVVFETGLDAVIRLETGGPVRAVRPPASAQFRNPPRKDAALGVPMTPADRARFVVPEPGQRLLITWPAGPERSGSGELRLRGTALLDAGARGIILRVLRAPSGTRPGDAVLLSDTRVAGPARAGPGI
jgi:hypothetical protein